MQLRKNWLMALTLVSALTLMLIGSGASNGGQEYIEIAFDGTTMDTHAGPGPHPTEESRKYSLLKVNGVGSMIGWGVGDEVEYQIIDAPQPRLKSLAAVNASVATLDEYITTRTFQYAQDTDQLNPCTGEPNSISWRTGDG